MFALIDANNFYCSCERVFRPDLRHKAVAVLSNNDGCVVARSEETKAMGVAMGTPFFQVQHLVKQKRLTVFSSNYELYHNFSDRMVQSIRSLVPEVEVYSIDESFADMGQLHAISALRPLGLAIKARVWQWVGLPTCVGIARTKTLAKFCNFLAKRHKQFFAGVVVWDDWSPAIQERALRSAPVTEIWGIGRRIGRKLQAQSIQTAWDFVQAHTPTLRRQFGVMLERTQREMRGIVCEDLVVTEDPKQSIVRSRSFAQMVTSLPSLQAALSHHVQDAAAHLRQHHLRAGLVRVFIHSNRFREDLAQYHGVGHAALHCASDDTLVLNQLAQQVLQRIYNDQVQYKKCGVELTALETSTQAQQIDLWQAQNLPDHTALMQVWDELSQRFGRQALQLGHALGPNDWRMQRNFLSPCFTTRWCDIPVI